MARDAAQGRDGRGAGDGVGCFADDGAGSVSVRMRDAAPAFRLTAVTERALCPDSLFARLDALVGGCVGRPAAGAAGFDRVILREKDLDPASYANLIDAALAFSADPGALMRALVVHTHVGVARRLGIPRVHLPLPALERLAMRGCRSGGGSREGSGGGSCAGLDARPAGCPGAAEALAGFDEVSTSVHSVEEARRALDLGANVLVAGHVFTTACKQGLAPRGLSFLRQVVDVAGTGANRAATRDAAAEETREGATQGDGTENGTPARHVPVLAIGGIAVDTVASAAQVGAAGACVRGLAMEDPDPATLAARLRSAVEEGR